jgi:O-antigen/teichoic acid export membrane protein
MSMTPASAEPELLLAPTTHGATRTAIAQLTARALSVLVQVASLGVVARVADVTQWASWGTVLLLVAIASFLLDPGLSPIVIRRLSTSPADAPLPRAMLPVRIALGILAVVVVCAVTLALRGGADLLLALALAGQLLPRSIVLNATPWLQIDQRLHRQTILEALVAAIGLSSLLVAAWAGASVVVLALVGFTIPTALLAVLMRRELRITPSRRADLPGPQWPRVISTLREVGPFALAILITASYTRLAVVFLQGSGVTDAERGRFFFAFQFVEQLIVGAGIVAAAVLPLLTSRARGVDLLADVVTHRLVAAVTAVGALISAVTIAVAVPVTDLIGGPTKTGAGEYLQLMAPMAAVVSPAMILGYVYVAISSTRRYLVIASISLVVTVIANLLFTLPHGAPAAARIVWMTDAVVVMLPLWPVARSSASGARQTGRVALLLIACGLAAEASLHLAPVLAACLLALAVAALAHGPLLWLLRAVGGPSGRRRAERA